jgi:hypothetical protein
MAENRLILVPSQLEAIVPDDGKPDRSAVLPTIPIMAARFQHEGLKWACVLGILMLLLYSTFSVGIRLTYFS